MWSKRAKEKAPETEKSSQMKKRKPPDERNDLIIRLDEKTRTALSLTNEEILMIGDLAYLPNTTSRSFYIYDIVSRVCNCPIEAVKLYRQTHGELRDEKDKGWRPVNPNMALKGGYYLCNCKEEYCKKLELDPVLISAGGQSKSRMSTPLTTRPNSREGTSDMSLISAESSFPSKISSLLKQTISNQATSRIALDELKKRFANGATKFRDEIISRDRHCVLGPSLPKVCTASHIIPVSLILRKLLHNEKFDIGDGVISTPYDTRLGILLEKSTDHHFDAYEASIYTGNNPPVLHLMKNQYNSESGSWLPSTEQYEGSVVRIANISWQCAILDHHYRHSVVLAWGSSELKEMLRPLKYDADENEFALLMSLIFGSIESLDDSLTPPSSSAY